LISRSAKHISDFSDESLKLCERDFGFLCAPTLPLISTAAKAHQIACTLGATEDVKIFWIGKIKFAWVFDEDTQRFPIQASGALRIRKVLQDILL
jgi:hypothetical protein